MISLLLGNFKPILSKEDVHKNGTLWYGWYSFSDKFNYFVVSETLLRMGSVICVQNPRFVFYLI